MLSTAADDDDGVITTRQVAYIQSALARPGGITEEDRREIGFAILQIAHAVADDTAEKLDTRSMDILAMAAQSTDETLQRVTADVIGAASQHTNFAVARASLELYERVGTNVQALVTDAEERYRLHLQEQVGGFANFFMERMRSLYDFTSENLVTVRADVAEKHREVQASLSRDRMLLQTALIEANTSLRTHADEAVSLVREDARVGDKAVHDAVSNVRDMAMSKITKLEALLHSKLDESSLEHVLLQVRSAMTLAQRLQADVSSLKQDAKVRASSVSAMESEVLKLRETSDDLAEKLAAHTVLAADIARCKGSIRSTDDLVKKLRESISRLHARSPDPRIDSASVQSLVDGAVDHSLQHIRQLLGDTRSALLKRCEASEAAAASLTRVNRALASDIEELRAAVAECTDASRAAASPDAAALRAGLEERDALIDRLGVELGSLRAQVDAQRVEMRRLASALEEIRAERVNDRAETTPVRRRGAIMAQDGQASRGSVRRNRMVPSEHVERSSDDGSFQDDGGSEANSGTEFSVPCSLDSGRAGTDLAGFAAPPLDSGWASLHNIKLWQWGSHPDYANKADVVVSTARNDAEVRPGVKITRGVAADVSALKSKLIVASTLLNDKIKRGTAGAEDAIAVAREVWNIRGRLLVAAQAISSMDTVHAYWLKFTAESPGRIPTQDTFGRMIVDAAKATVKKSADKPKQYPTAAAKLSKRSGRKKSGNEEDAE